MDGFEDDSEVPVRLPSTILQTSEGTDLELWWRVRRRRHEVAQWNGKSTTGISSDRSTIGAKLYCGERG